MTVPARTYLDHNATTPLRPQARDAMIAAFDTYGNPSSVHAEGRRARAIVEQAREQVAALVGASPSEIVFTSGATEANAWVMAAGWSRLIIGATEHASVLAPASLASAEFAELPVDANGIADLAVLSDELAAARPATGRTLVSLHLANAETGTLQPLAEVAAIARAHGVLVHTDAVQVAGRLPIAFRSDGVDLMSISAHKLGGPKGIGALVIRDGLEIAPLVRGGGQERRRRGGTEAVTLIAGFGAAAAAASSTLHDWQRIATLRETLEAGVRRITPDAVIFGEGASRLPNTVYLARAGEQSATRVIRLDLAGVAVSAGSACSSGKIAQSHVLAAMGVAPALADSAVRLSLGWCSTAADVEAFLGAWARTTASGTSADLSPAAAAFADREGQRTAVGE